MPKQGIKKEDILAAAFAMTKEFGFESINARSIAQHMGYSVQPIYSYFVNMDALKAEVYEKALLYYQRFIVERTDQSNYLLSMGLANIAFAKAEIPLFRLLFLTRLNGLNCFSDIYERMGDKAAAQVVAHQLQISDTAVKDLYLMMIVFTHGIATMLATGGANIADPEIIAFMESAFSAFCAIQKKAE